MLLTATCLAALLAPQIGADSAIARFQIAGAEAFVTADDLALELALRYRKTQRRFR